MFADLLQRHRQFRLPSTDLFFLGELPGTHWLPEAVNQTIPARDDGHAGRAPRVIRTIAPRAPRSPLATSRNLENETTSYERPVVKLPLVVQPPAASSSPVGRTGVLTIR
jgi:hypothetical protein